MKIAKFLLIAASAGALMLPSLSHAQSQKTIYNPNSNASFSSSGTMSAARSGNPQSLQFAVYNPTGSPPKSVSRANFLTGMKIKSRNVQLSLVEKVAESLSEYRSTVAGPAMDSYEAAMEEGN
jgi:hypothetical protein